MKTTDTIKADKEIDMKPEDKLYYFCPYCGKQLHSYWQHISQDDCNPVRACKKCDIAWIWHVYG